MRISVAMLAVALAACTAEPAAGPGTARVAPASEAGDARLIGTWLLESTRFVHAQTGEARPDPVRGLRPRGILTIDDSGYLANQTVDSDRTEAAVQARLRTASGETGVGMALGYGAYYGRYEVDRAAGTFTTTIIDGFHPSLRGQVATRYYRIDGDRLTVSFTRPGPDGELVRAEWVWRRPRR